MKHLKAIIIKEHCVDCEDYINKHGKHFTNELVHYVSGLMENSDGTKHIWTVDQVEKALVDNGFTIEGSVTKANLADITYLANMYYADMFPDPLKTEKEIIAAANRTAQDPDGYEGMIFLRWLADAKGKEIEIDWKKYI